MRLSQSGEQKRKELIQHLKKIVETNEKAQEIGLLKAILHLEAKTHTPVGKNTLNYAFYCFTSQIKNDLDSALEILLKLTGIAVPRTCTKNPSFAQMESAIFTLVDNYHKENTLITLPEVKKAFRLIDKVINSITRKDFDTTSSAASLYLHYRKDTFQESLKTLKFLVGIVVSILTASPISSSGEEKSATKSTTTNKPLKAAIKKLKAYANGWSLRTNKNKRKIAKDLDIQIKTFQQTDSSTKANHMLLLSIAKAQADHLQLIWSKKLGYGSLGKILDDLLIASANMLQPKKGSLNKHQLFSLKSLNSKEKELALALLKTPS